MKLAWFIALCGLCFDTGCTPVVGLLRGFSPQTTAAASSASPGARIESGLVRSIPAAKEASRYEAHDKEIWTLNISGDGTRLATGSLDGTVKIWETATMRELTTLRETHGVAAELAFSLNGGFLAAVLENGTAKVWNSDTGDVLATFAGPAWATSIDLSPDGKTVAVGFQDGKIKILDAVTGKDIYILKRHAKIVEDLEFGRDGKRLVTGSGDGTAKIWNTETGNELWQLKDQRSHIFAVAFSPDGSSVATGGLDSTVFVWDVASGDVVMSMELNNNVLCDILFAPDGKLFAMTGRAGVPIIWDVASGKPLMKLLGHRGGVCSVVPGPEGRNLIGGGKGGSIRIWEWSP